MLLGFFFTLIFINFNSTKQLMKYITKLALILILFYSCKNNQIQNNFVLLPKVKNIEFSGESSLLNHDSYSKFLGSNFI